MWKDITTYSRNEKDCTPTTFEVREGGLRIVITCGHIHYKHQWVMHCAVLAIDTYQLKENSTEDQAKAEALEIVSTRIDELKMWFDIIMKNQSPPCEVVPIMGQAAPKAPTSNPSQLTLAPKPTISRGVREFDVLQEILKIVKPKDE